MGIFAEMVINQKLRHEKLNNVDQSNAIVNVDQSNAIVISVSADESQQKMFNYQELKIVFNMCKIFDKLI